MKKLSNTEADLKKFIAYKKACYRYTVSIYSSVPVITIFLEFLPISSTLNNTTKFEFLSI